MLSHKFSFALLSLSKQLVYVAQDAYEFRGKGTCRSLDCVGVASENVDSGLSPITYALQKSYSSGYVAILVQLYITTLWKDTVVKCVDAGVPATNQFAGTPAEKKKLVAKSSVVPQRPSRLRD